MKLKVLCLVALVLGTILISSASTETSKDEKKYPKVAETVTAKNQAAKGAIAEDGQNLCYRKCCKPYHGCYCCSGNDMFTADVVYELDMTTGQYMLAGYGGGGWGGGGGRGGGGGGWGGGGRGGGGGWGGGGRCPHCTAEEAAEMAREGKELDKTSGQYMFAGYGGGGWGGGGGRGGGGGWGGGGRGGGGGGGRGGGGGGGGGGRCPHCTAEEAAEMARKGKP